MRPVQTLPSLLDNENIPYVKPTGFREYDARWLFEKDINLLGIQAVGRGIAEVFARHNIEKKIVVGHDFRSYSQTIKNALITGLMNGGMDIFDVGLAVSPMAYFAQFHLNVPGVAMVTASHNDNGWTGIKMGKCRPCTFGPDDMQELKNLVLEGDLQPLGGGKLTHCPEITAAYKADLLKRNTLTRPLKVVCATGNGTAGAFSPEVLEGMGCTVIPLHTDLDWTFPHHNPNPEDMNMLNSLADAVKEHSADIGFAFDGDGDRCGIVDETGTPIFADKIGLLLARDLAKLHPNAQFVVDVKSTGLFAKDDILAETGAQTLYWKTGHSYIKAKCAELNALAGFEKSGHFFFNKPLGYGYDDGLLTALAILEMLEREQGTPLSKLYAALPQTWQSPTIAAHCADEVKYDVVERAMVHFSQKTELAGQKVVDNITINGIRMVLADGTWGLVRASSNKPELVVVVESPTSAANMRAIFQEIDTFLQAQDEVGGYNQTL